MSSVNQPEVVTADQPFWITVNSTKPSGIRTMTRDSPISTVARALRTDRPDRFGLRSAGGSAGGAVKRGGHAPRVLRIERLTTARAVRFTMIVKTNSTTPRPMRAARQRPELSPNSLAMTDGIE